MLSDFWQYLQSTFIWSSWTNLTCVFKSAVVANPLLQTLQIIFLASLCSFFIWVVNWVFEAKCLSQNTHFSSLILSWMHFWWNFKPCIDLKDLSHGSHLFLSFWSFFSVERIWNGFVSLLAKSTFSSPLQLAAWISNSNVPNSLLQIIHWSAPWAP